MSLVTVREHARLTIGSAQATSLDEASIPLEAFDWLCGEAQRFRRGGATLVQIESRRWLRLDNFVGVLESPGGTRIEILPKYLDGDSSLEDGRRVLRRMLQHSLRLPSRDMGVTGLQTFDAPVNEWIMQQFLAELDALVRRGMQFDYRHMEEELRFMRGRLLVSHQLRQPLGRQHLFQVEHQVFDANRPENRLIVSALDKVAALTRDQANWRLSHELAHQTAEIHRSQDRKGDFRLWSSDRRMARYGRIRPWCELILADRNPLSTLGSWTGRSLLFPMERVFERYVEVCLRRALPAGATLEAQARSRHLCLHEGRNLFQLRPDFILEYDGVRRIIDAKWKILDGGDRADNYGLKQGDFYQMFAYGKRYLDGVGQLALVFPANPSFTAPLAPFDLQDGLSLEVLPLDLERGECIACSLPAGMATHLPAGAGATFLDRGRQTMLS